MVAYKYCSVVIYRSDAGNEIFVALERIIPITRCSVMIANDGRPR